jgi:AraC-like DNA-binding protein
MSRSHHQPAGPEWVRAWKPVVAGVREVFHARFVDYAYPPHVHDTWTLFIVDDGWIRYDLESRHRGAGGSPVTILPPHVVHDGRAATGRGFRKRVLYLGADVLDERLIGRAVDRPDMPDPALRLAVQSLHRSLGRPDDALEAESWLALVTDHLHTHLAGRPRQLEPPSRPRPETAGPGYPRRPGLGDPDPGNRLLAGPGDPGSWGPRRQRPEGGVPRSPGCHPRRLAGELRDLLDGRLFERTTLAEAGGELGASPSHLVRCFTQTFGIAPHQYVLARRIDAARPRLLDGHPVAQVAADVGFYDQAHFTRQFRRHVGSPPGRYARSSGR